MRKVISILFAIFLLANISVISVYASYTLTNDAYTVANYARAAVGTHEMSKKGLCQTFAWECLYNTLGVSNKAGCGCCATKAWQSYGVSSSRDDIPLGAMVYFGGSSTIDSCGQEAGHVGVYIGNNEIAHAWSSTVICKTTIDYVITCGYYYRGWGWQGGYPLATIEKPTGAWMWKNKSSVAVGEEIKFNYNATGATHFILGIDKAGSGRVRTVDMGASDWYTTTFSEPGTYTIYATCYNSFGYQDSNVETFTVYNTKPTGSWIATDKTATAVGGNITINYGANNVWYYEVGITDPQGKLSVYQQGTNTSFTHTFTQAGTYYVAVACWNVYGNNPTEYIQINVYDTKPTGSWIATDKTVTAVGGNITINYGANNVWYYEVGITDPQGKLSVYQQGTNTSFTHTFTQAGTYYVAVACWNEYGNNPTEYIQIKVCDQPTYSTVTKKDSTYLINTMPLGIDYSCEIIIAGYKGSKFVTLKSIPYEFNEINTTLSGDMDEIKVMVLDSLSGLKPLSKAEVIPSSKFISE